MFLSFVADCWNKVSGFPSGLLKKVMEVQAVMGKRC